MRRMLITLVMVVIVGAGAFLLGGQQERAAIGLPLPGDALMQESAANRAAPVDSIDRPDAVETPVLAQVDSFAQPFAASETTPAKAKKQDSPSSATSDFRVEGATPLQVKYVKLMLNWARRMSEQELETSIEEAETGLKQQDEAAEAELQKAIEILRQLQETSAGTPAATRAAHALQTLEGDAFADPTGGANPTLQPASAIEQF
jgi:hypothetical protein